MSNALTTTGKMTNYTVYVMDDLSDLTVVIDSFVISNGTNITMPATTNECGQFFARNAINIIYAKVATGSPGSWTFITIDNANTTIIGNTTLNETYLEFNQTHESVRL